MSWGGSWGSSWGSGWGDSSGGGSNSAWGDSWADAWGDSWGSVEVTEPVGTASGVDQGGTTYHGDRNLVRQRYENQKALALLLTLVTDF